MWTYTYTVFDGNPQDGGTPIPPMTEQRVKAKDSYTALVRAQCRADTYVRTSCDYVGTHRYYVLVWRDKVLLEKGYVDVDKQRRPYFGTQAL